MITSTTATRWLGLAALAALLQACATPVGNFTDADYVWERRTLDQNYQAVYRTVYQTSKKCSGVVTEGEIYTDIGEGSVHVYLGNGMFAGRSDWVLGTVRIKRLTEDQTEVAVGVNRKHDKPLFGQEGAQRATIMGWADGVSGCS